MFIQGCIISLTTICIFIVNWIQIYNLEKNTMNIVDADIHLLCTFSVIVFAEDSF